MSGPRELPDGGDLAPCEDPLPLLEADDAGVAFAMPEDEPVEDPRAARLVEDLPDPLADADAAVVEPAVFPALDEDALDVRADPGLVQDPLPDLPESPALDLDADVLCEAPAAALDLPEAPEGSETDDPTLGPRVDDAQELVDPLLAVTASRLRSYFCR